MISNTCFAFPNSIGIGVKNHLFGIAQSLSIDIPLNENGDSAEIRYGNYTISGNDATNVYILYRKCASNNNNVKDTVNIGFAFYSYKDKIYSFNSSSVTNTEIYVVGAVEKEALIFDNLSGSVRFGWPEIVGVGLTYYL